MVVPGPAAAAPDVHMAEPLAEGRHVCAERLLRDIKLAHAAMVARLDQATPGAVESDPRPRRARGTGEGNIDVPEFMPGA